MVHLTVCVTPFSCDNSIHTYYSTSQRSLRISSMDNGRTDIRGLTVG